MHCPEKEESSSLEKSSALDLGDCIGIESCVDLRTDLLDLEKEIKSANQNKNRRPSERRTKMEKEYPPPIPSLARTGNFPSHMPWVMKRYCTDDGSLILRLEKVKRREYFQAHRSNGRLTLRLVFDDLHEEEEEEEIDNAETEAAEEDESMPNSSESSSCMEKTGGGECYKSVRRSSCMFGMALPASSRPVRS